MSNKFYVTFDKSNEDIPTLVIFTESWSLISPSMVVQNVITGNRAVELWHELQGKQVQVTIGGNENANRD